MKLIKRIFYCIKDFMQNRKNKKLQKQQPMGLSYIDARQETNVLDVDLVDDNATKQNKKKLRQFTKIIITTLTISAIVWITWSYVLASIALILYGNPEPMSSLSEKVCEVVLGTVIAYCLKAFFETFAEKSMELVDTYINNKVVSIEDSKIETNNEEAVG